MEQDFNPALLRLVDFPPFLFPQYVGGSVMFLSN